MPCVVCLCVALRKLLLALVADGGSRLYSGQVTSSVDASAGVRQLLSSSTGASRLLPLPSAEAARIAILKVQTKYPPPPLPWAGDNR